MYQTDICLEPQATVTPRNIKLLVETLHKISEDKEMSLETLDAQVQIICGTIVPVRESGRSTKESGGNDLISMLERLMTKHAEQSHKLQILTRTLQQALMG
jgi:hypothetical protein